MRSTGLDTNLQIQQNQWSVFFFFTVKINLLSQLKLVHNTTDTQDILVNKVQHLSSKQNGLWTTDKQVDSCKDNEKFSLEKLIT